MRERETTLLGSAQLPISRIGIGTWAIGGGWGPQPEAISLQALHTALDSGCKLIDTAPLYGNGRAERLIAQAFRERHQRVSTLTKVYPLNYHWAPSPGTPISTIYPSQHIVEQVHQSLKQLETDCLDGVFLQTWCPSWSEETDWYETLLSLREQGKIRAFGISVSDHRPDEANGVILAGRVDIVEVAYSILDQRAAERLFPLAQEHQVSIIARSALASGALAGNWHEDMKFHRDDWRRRVFRGELLQQTIQRIDRLKVLLEADLAAPLAQVALRFCLSHPAVAAVIPGVRNAEQVICDLSADEQQVLSSEILDKIAYLWREEFRYNVRTSIGEEGEGERRKLRLKELP